MNSWKVILATLVIFTAGLFTGGLAVKQLIKPPQPPRPPAVAPRPGPLMGLPAILRMEFLDRMTDELELSAEQRGNIMKVVLESQERVKEIYSLVGPEVSEELRYVRESIRVELTPEQWARFEELQRRARQRRMGNLPHSEGVRMIPPQRPLNAPRRRTGPADPTPAPDRPPENTPASR